MITNGNGNENGLFGGEYSCSPFVMRDVIPRMYSERVRVFVSGWRRCGMCIQKYNAFMHVPFSTVFGILHRCLAS